MAIKAAELSVVIGADTNAAVTGLQAVSQKLSSFGQSAMITGGILTAGITLPLVGVAKQALSSAMDYQSALNLMQAVSGATNEQMQEVAKTAQELGADMQLPATSAGDAAQAMTELAKAGLSVDDTLAAAKGVLQLAAAGTLEEARAAEIAANALNAFQLEGSEATKVADLLSAAANASSAEVTDIADSFQMSSAVFSEANISIEDLTASIGQMANVGIKGSDAGTSLKQMILSLQAPTDKAADLMSDLGISIYDASGTMLPFGDVIGQFSDKLGGLTQEERNAALATIFGSDAIRAANIVLMDGVEAHSKMVDAVSRTGAAAELARAKMKGLKGALEGLKSQVETVWLAMSEPFLDTLEGWVRGISDLIPKIMEIDPSLRNAALAFLAVLAAAGPVISIVGILSSALGFLLSPLGMVTVAVGALAAAWAGDWGDIREKAAEVWGELQPLLQDMGVWLKKIIPYGIARLKYKWEELWGKVGPKLEDFWNNTALPALQGMVTWLQEKLPFAIGWVKEKWDNFWSVAGPILSDFWNSIALPTLQGIIPWLQEKLPQAIEWLSSRWTEFWNIAGPILSNFWNNYALPALQGFVPWLQEKLPQAINWLSTKWNELWSIAGPILSAFWYGLALPALQQLIPWLQEKIPIAITWLSTTWNSFWSVAGPMLSNFWYGIALPALQQLGPWLQEKLPAAVTWLRETWDVAWNAISGVVSYVTTQIGTLLEAFQAAREGDWYTFGEKLREIWDTAWAAITTAAETIWNNLKEKFSGWIEDIKNFFTTTDWKATGQSILEGISQGITGYIETVKKNAEDTAKAIWDTIRGFFGIKSPATKMIEIGKMLIEGLIDGFVGGVALVAEGVGKLVEAFKNVGWLDIGKSIVADINSGLTNSMQSMLNAVNSLATQAAAKILAYNWYNVGKAVVRQLSGGISGNASILSSAISSLLSGSSGGISYSSWYYVGRQIVNYIASGVKANQSALTGAISSLLGSAKVSADSVISNWKYSEPSFGGNQPTGALAGVTVGGPTVNVILNANVSNNLDIEEITYHIASRLRSYL